MKSRKDILLKILDTIGYEDDKESFATEFEQNIQLQAFDELLRSLSTDEQVEIKDKLVTALNDVNKVLEILKSKFSDSQIQQSLDTATQEMFTSYLEYIDPALSQTQRNELIAVLREAMTQDPNLKVAQH